MIKLFHVLSGIEMYVIGVGIGVASALVIGETQYDFRVTLTA